MKQSLILFIALIGLIAFSSPVRAHGNHFGSVEELAAHIDGHVAYLEGLLAESPRSSSEVNRQYAELIDHAKQYQRFARTLIRHDEHVLMAQSLELISGYLVDAARGRDIEKSLGHLKEIQSLLHSELAPVVPVI